MEQIEILLAYQEEDMKAETLSNEISNSPERKQLEKLRDRIKECQKQHKEIEDAIISMNDRKQAIEDTLDEYENKVDEMTGRFNANPPQSLNDVKSLLDEINNCRSVIRQYETEIRHIVSESTERESVQRSLKQDAVKAKKDFDTLKTSYDEVNKNKRADLEQQRSKVDKMAEQIEPALLERYLIIRKRAFPPIMHIQYGKCSGCNTSLPSAVLSKIQHGVLIECETCGRMIIQ